MTPCRLLPLILAVVTAPGPRAQATATVAPQLVPELGGAGWESQDVGVGVRLHRLRQPELFGRPQAITVVAFDPRRVRFRTAAAEPFARVRTSSLALEHPGSLAAVNGGFFDVKTGVPNGLLIQGGTLRHPATGARDEGAVVVDRRRRLPVLAADPEAEALRGVAEALSSWPVLLQDGEVVRPEGFDPDGARHPRSVVGWTAGGRTMLWIAVDGRHDEAAGMTYVELVALLRGLDCVDGLNLDGGGSTTLWVRTAGGVVNHPSDNRRFDRAGERAVSNALVALAAAIRTWDEDSTAAVPPAGMAAVRRDDALRGDVWITAADSDHSAPARCSFVIDRSAVCADTTGWQLEIHLPGRTDDADPTSLRVEWLEQSRPVRLRRTARWVVLGELAPSDETVEVSVLADRDGSPLLLDAVRVVEQR